MATTSPGDTDDLSPVRRARTAGRRVRERVGRPVRTASFWAAVALPAVYLPLLLTNPATTSEQYAVSALIVLHALALFVGRSHRRE